MNCNMCGSEGQLYKAEIEGTILVVCTNCAGYGKVLSKVKAPLSEQREEIKKTFTSHAAPEVIEVIIPEYPQKIKNAREKKGLKQKDLALLLHEKESIIHALETGNYEPNMDLARKLEKFFKITLVQEMKEQAHTRKGDSESKEMTLGDLIAIKQRKKVKK